MVMNIILPFDSMFWIAPIITANINGVVPNFAVIGAKKAGNNVNEKNAIPVVNKVIGVINAATPHPNCLNTTLPASIINNVTIPVIVEKLPINIEYEFGSGKAAFNLLFHVTSTILIAIPYPITTVARSLI